ncbi:hypothetical protein COCSUDRAFT_52473 [Coccomyxa subellipsoidea C-169]|uniref:AD domain-containing protein n=1 Tax=Coccomyxa subellipsoidea (strain C-169) TaxID=574566 RepID=I0Z869_COCSC|nr:hypothetical protein COCSUDRAFT_52473 [Coccomyxa subellipsoidea C-169]EIE26838.1 hypothetical protein COCSUDRAFT_52473 [Coccomyxa subellipsoidea C-169]|eukprot:XP_005651382.1 hypothetical protein COCSUDRAFT_52473 [Coccomyxa subellipsoidea C-169]
MNAQQEPDHQYSVGSSIVLETLIGEVVKGEVFAQDRGTKCIILREPTEGAAKCNLRVLKEDFIKKVVSSKIPKDYVVAKLPHVDISKCLDREAKAVQAAEFEAARKGLGVTEEAQRIFDALSKTMPCKWQGKTIVVLGEVSIKEPYDLASVSSTHPDNGAAIVERVKKVLDAERKRMTS